MQYSAKISLRVCLIECSIEILNENGNIVYAVDGLAEDRKTVAKFGILKPDLAKYPERGLLSGLGQFYGIVGPGLIMAKHLFLGLNRPLYCDGSMEGDCGKLIYSWNPVYDYEWAGGPSYGRLECLPAPRNSAFAVIVSKNVRHTKEFPSIYGWIERWNWIAADAYISDAPINWASRYREKVY